MKKHLSKIALGLALLGSVVSYSQNGNKVLPCATYEATETYFQQNPEARIASQKAAENFEKAVSENKNNHAKTAAVQYTIPVVFHILHQGGSENVSDQTIINAVNWVNNDLAKAQNDASLTAAPFSSLFINSDIKLMLAKKDPNGNCTNGIVRHFDAKTNWSQSGASSNSYWPYTWDRNNYLNVYIVASIASQGTVTGGGIIVGYTFKPTTLVGANMDAIVYRYDYLNGGATRSLTHELGHWLNLSHTWGDTNNPGVSCSGDDNCADTPPTKGNFGGCPSSLSGNTCAGSGGLDNVQNIMNYSDCPINFTTDQTNRMRTAISTIAKRTNLVSAGNLVTTGVNDVTGCAPVAQFMSSTNSYTVCSGGSIDLKSISYNGTIASFSWSGDNGVTFANPTASVTAATFPSVGVSVVTLSTSNGQGSSSDSKTITVINGAAQVPNNYFESFEAPGLPPNWFVGNPDAGTISWEQTNIAAIEGTSCYYIEGLVNQPSNRDYLQMPVINPQLNANNTVFTFKYAYARYSASHNNIFEVQASTDCGGTWNTIVSLGSAILQNGSGGVLGTAYVPQPNEWVTYDVYAHPNWFTYTGYPSVLVRFMYQEDPNGAGNRFFLDDIIFSDPNGVNDLTKSISFGLSPNPTTGEATVKFNLQDAANVQINVTDVLGRNVIDQMDFNFGPGEQAISVNKNNTLGKGIYFVNLSVNGAKMSRKLIVE